MNTSSVWGLPRALVINVAVVALVIAFSFTVCAVSKLKPMAKTPAVVTKTVSIKPHDSLSQP